jgi:hypothetical protein
MTDIEQKALALLNKVLAERPFGPNDNYIYVTLCRAIEQHEAFRQEVSDAVEGTLRSVSHWQGCDVEKFRAALSRFIIAKPDPVRMLVEALAEVPDETIRLIAESKDVAVCRSRIADAIRDLAIVKKESVNG